MWSLTHERVERLSRQISDREMEIDALLKPSSPSSTTGSSSPNLAGSTALAIGLKFFSFNSVTNYERRKQHQLSELQKELEKLSNQARFVQMIINGSS
jgi:hypothetical protein